MHNGQGVNIWEQQILAFLGELTVKVKFQTSDLENLT